MFAALLVHLVSIPAYAMYLLFAVPAEGWRHAWKRLPLFVLCWFVYSLLTLLHIIGHVSDEILFHRYRRVIIREPVFILGIPRSGTTYLQRLLGNIEGFSTFTTWEALLAPSISERYCYRALGWLLTPVERGVIALRRKLFHHMDKIHRIRLQEPEEDFLLLLPLMACLLAAFACPRSRHFWRLGRFDKNFPDWYKKLVMTFYARCLQKHIYFHGRRLRILSKNPSFTPLADSLLATFRDAKIIACTRAPEEVLPSQLSSLRPAMNVLGCGKLSPNAQDKLIGILHHYYARLLKYQHDPRFHFLPMTALRFDFSRSMSTLVPFLALDGPAFLSQIIARAQANPDHASSHRYSLAEFSLTDSFIRDKFHDVWPMQPSAANQESRST